MRIDTLKEILNQHKLWVTSTGTQGIRANLSGANLPYPIYQAYLGQYHIHTNRKYVRIGCCYKTVSKWLSITLQEANEMGLKEEYYEDYRKFVQWYANKLSKGEIV